MASLSCPVSRLLGLLGLAKKLLGIGLLRTHRDHAEKGHNCGEWTDIS
jgi:hypothetical protein